MGGDGLGDGVQGVTEVQFKEGAGVLGVRAIGRVGEISGEMFGGSCASGIRRKRMALARGARLAAGRERRGAGVRASSADRWARGRLLASARVSGGCGPSAGSELKRELGRAQRGGAGKRGARWAAARWAGRVCAGGVGPGERVRGSRPGWAACWGGKENWARKEGLGWVWVSGFLGWFGFSVFSFSFLFLNKTNLIEFKPNLNSNPMHSTKQIKLMHQYECTNKFKSKINFNYLRNKILD